MPVIILEGPDESGKSHLANRLGLIFNAKVIHSPVHGAERWDDEWNYWALNAAKEAGDDYIILDRTPEISELVYGSIVPGRHIRLADPWTIFERLLESPDIFMVFCENPYPDLEGIHLDSLGNNVKAYHQQVGAMYRSLSSQTGYRQKTKIWNYNYSTIDLLERHIRHFFLKFIVTEQYAHEIDLRDFQENHKIWLSHNFPDQHPYQPLLGLIEEVGELAHAHLKMEQGIRDSTIADVKDAVGDILIYLASYCNANGIYLTDAANEAWKQVKNRDWIKYPKDGRTK